MNTKFSQLDQAERDEMHRGLLAGQSLRTIAKSLGRSASTLSRERRRNSVPAGSYDALMAGRKAINRRRVCRPHKLAEGSALAQRVYDKLRRGWSPEQISGHLKQENPTDRSRRVSHETIYTAIYAMPKGELRRELINELRRAHKRRVKRTGGTDRRGHLSNMKSIHIRPPEVASREIPGHWEGDLIKGAGNRSAVATLVERKSRFVLLVKVKDSSAEAIYEGFIRVFRHVPSGMRKTLTYDQGKEMAWHAKLEKRLRLEIFFADPHSPWQRGTNENTNGLLREYLPKGIDLSTFSQKELNLIAQALNTRPRKCLEFKTPEEVFLFDVMALRQRVAIQI